jgi:hypothetical protein
MAIDQQALGQQAQALMEEIENDPDIPDKGHIGRVIMIVEVFGESDDGEEQSFNLRVNSGANPHVAIGFLEVAKQIQFKMMGLS